MDKLLNGKKSNSKNRCLIFDSVNYISRFAARKGLELSDSDFAKVAQLVEHDLAKVGVASSNLVFRSKCLSYRKAFILKVNRLLGWWNW